MMRRGGTPAMRREPDMVGGQALGKFRRQISSAFPATGKDIPATQYRRVRVLRTERKAV